MNLRTVSSNTRFLIAIESTGCDVVNLTGTFTVSPTLAVAASSVKLAVLGITTGSAGFTVTAPALTVALTTSASFLTTAVKETFAVPSLSALNVRETIASFEASNTVGVLRANDAYGGLF